MWCDNHLGRSKLFSCDCIFKTDLNISSICLKLQIFFLNLLQVFSRWEVGGFLQWRPFCPTVGHIQQTLCELLLWLWRVSLILSLHLKMSFYENVKNKTCQ